MSVMGLDIGTTGVKACIFDAGGKLLARHYREYPLLFPQPGWSEIDPKQVLDATKAVVAAAAGEATSKGDAVAAVCVSAQGEAVTPVDAKGAPLGNSIVTFDARTAPYVSFWEEKLGRGEFFRITGMPLHGMYTLPKVQWWKDNRPKVHKNAKRYLCYEDLAAQAVFGLEPVIGTSLAGRAGAYDLHARGWSEKLFGIAGLDTKLFARPLAAGTVAGEIPAAACDSLSLAPKAKLVVGGHDQALCAIGCGIDRPGPRQLRDGHRGVHGAGLRRHAPGRGDGAPQLLLLRERPARQAHDHRLQLHRRFAAEVVPRHALSRMGR